MIKKIFIALYEDRNILYFNENSGNVVFFSGKIGILNIDINLDNNCDEDDSSTIIIMRFLAWHIKFEKIKAF